MLIRNLFLITLLSHQTLQAYLIKKQYTPLPSKTRKLTESGDLNTLYTHLEEIFKKSIKPQISTLILTMDEANKKIKINKKAKPGSPETPINQQDLGYVILTDIHNEEENKHYFEFVLQETENPKVHIMLGTKKIEGEEKYEEIDKLAGFIAEDLEGILIEEENLEEDFVKDVAVFNEGFLDGKGLDCEDLKGVDTDSVVFSCKKDDFVVFETEFFYLKDINHYKANLKCRQNVYEVFLNNLKPIGEKNSEIFESAKKECNEMDYSVKPIKEVFEEIYTEIVKNNFDEKNLEFDYGTNDCETFEKNYCVTSIYHDKQYSDEENDEDRKLSLKTQKKTNLYPNSIKISKTEKWGKTVTKKNIIIKQDTNETNSPRKLYEFNVATIDIFKYNFLGQLYYQINYGFGKDNKTVFTDYLIPASDPKFLQSNIELIKKEFLKIMEIKSLDEKSKKKYTRKEIRENAEKILKDVDCILNEKGEDENKDEIWTNMKCFKKSDDNENVLNVQFSDENERVFHFIFNCQYLDKGDGNVKNYHSEIVIPSEKFDMSFYDMGLEDLKSKMDMGKILV